jgi:plastocyanin
MRSLPLAALLLPIVAGAPATPVARRAFRAPVHVEVRGRVTISERGGESTRDLPDAVVWLAPAAGTPERRAAVLTAAARPAEIHMQGRQFTPRVRVVALGTTVEFPNDDPFRHNAFSNSALGPFDLGLYGKGERKGIVPAKPGVWAIYCDIHARMRAHLVVVPTTLWAQPGPDGRFVIAAVPPGRYTLRAWHERGGETAQEITVGEAPVDAATLALDARGYALRPHKNKFGRDYPTRSGDRY